MFESSIHTGATDMTRQIQAHKNACPIDRETRKEHTAMHSEHVRREIRTSQDTAAACRFTASELECRTCFRLIEAATAFRHTCSICNSTLTKAAAEQQALQDAGIALDQGWK